MALILALALLVSAMPAALASDGYFKDISDNDVARAAETLRLLGVVDGVADGKFAPGDHLTRAQFCKMAIIMKGAEGLEPSYRNRTIFSDVTSTHWARGYINLAASGENAIISGMGNGLFAPDQNITFAQAVTILSRLLGYNDSDTSMQWPDGFMTLAESIGLTKGLSLDPYAAITRGQAAELFCSMLQCDTKDGGMFLSRFGSVTENVILLNNNAVAADGSSGGVFTSAGTYKTDVDIPDSYVGERGTVVVNGGKLIVFIPTGGSRKTVSASVIEAGWFKDSNGVRYSVPAATVVYTDSEIKTWGDIWLDMPVGSNITVYFDAKGSVEALFYATSAANDNVAVAMDEVKGNPFTSLLDGATGYQIYKNGAEASVSDLRRYDVAEYDKAAKLLRVNDVKLTGCYENVYPSTASPEKIKLLGQTFEVLPSAQESLAKFKLGDMMTLLFTSDMRVAGAVATADAAGNAVGIVKSWNSGDITVELLSAGRGGMTISGEAVSTGVSLVGELVVVSGSNGGKISVRPLGDNITAENINTETMTYGSYAISPAVKVFDRAGKSMPVRLSLASLPKEISREKVLYAHKDYAGRIDMLVLNDVTGDCYTYGAATTGTENRWNEFTGSYTCSVLTITGKDGAKTYDSYPVNVLNNNSYAGVATSLDGQRVLSAVNLTRIKDVSRSDFRTVNGVTTLTVDGVTYPVADNVQCYNSAAREWFESLDDARRFSSTLTVYYDRSPDQGGKIRIVVAG